MSDRLLVLRLVVPAAKPLAVRSWRSLPRPRARIRPPPERSPSLCPRAVAGMSRPVIPRRRTLSCPPFQGSTATFPPPPAGKGKVIVPVVFNPRARARPATPRPDRMSDRLLVLRLVVPAAAVALAISIFVYLQSGRRTRPDANARVEAEKPEGDEGATARPNGARSPVPNGAPSADLPKLDRPRADRMREDLRALFADAGLAWGSPSASASSSATANFPNMPTLGPNDAGEVQVDPKYIPGTRPPGPLPACPRLLRGRAQEGPEARGKAQRLLQDRRRPEDRRGYR